MSQSCIWSSVKPNIGIVCAYLRILLPLIRRCVLRWFGISNRIARSQPYYSMNYLRHRSQNGDFYTLQDRSKIRPKTKSDGEMGSTIEFKSDHRQPQDSFEDSIALDNHNAIIVKRDIEWSSTSASQV